MRCFVFSVCLISAAGCLADEIETVTVRGLRPTSLPSRIPTTIEGVTGEEIAAHINARDSEDALKYFPSLNVRKRYIGDFDHAVLASRASGTNNSARSLVFADGILLSNLLGNGATYTPRWGQVSPWEIERVDVLYGPFSAAYSGNSAGAVVDYVTRMPESREAHVMLATFTQQFDLYHTSGRFSGWQANAAVGDRTGALSWWLSFDHLDSDGQPMVFATRLLSAGTPGTAGTPVTGAVAGRNPRDQDWLTLGTSSQARTMQDHAKVKLAWDFSPAVRASYTFGWWANDVTRDAATYLHDAQGNAVYSGTINTGGRSYILSPADFTPTLADLAHAMHGISIRSDWNGAWDLSLSASTYDYARDTTRSATTALPAAATGGAGRIASQDGTGWSQFAAQGVWRPGVDRMSHQVDFGAQADMYRLRTRVDNTSDWQHGAPESRFSEFRGETQLLSLFAQDSWTVNESWRATLGLRWEHWSANDGSLSNAGVTREFDARSEDWLSPKFALAWRFAPEWELRASLGRAVRMPTVAELFQGSISADVIVNNDPDLKPERSWTGELSAQRDLAPGRWRATAFFEDTADALYSQTNVTVTPNVTSIQNVDRIRTWGLELAIDVPDLPVEGLGLTGSVTWAHSRIAANDNFPASVGKWQPRVPDWRATLLATWQASERWSVTLGGRYSGRQYNTLDNSDTNGFAFTGTSSFLVFDTRVRAKIGDYWTVSAGVDNIGNETYWAFHAYTQRTFAAEITADF